MSDDDSKERSRDAAAEVPGPSDPVEATDAPRATPAPSATPVPSVRSMPPALPSTTPEESPASPVLVSAVDVRGPRPLLGPSLWVAGVLLWAYVVMGILTTTRLPFMPKRMPVGEETAVFLVILAFTAAGIASVKRSLVASDGDPLRRAGRIAASAIGFWMLFVLGAIVFAALGFPDGVITLLLVTGSGVAVWFGRKLTQRGVSISDQSRLVPIACWIGAAVLTAMTLLAR